MDDAQLRVFEAAVEKSSRAVCVCVCDRISKPHPAVFAPEMTVIRTAACKRQAEFEAGRAVARRALAKAGKVFDAPIGQAENGAPIWPQGVIGSIAHCQDIAIAVVVHGATGTQGIGVDFEPRAPLPEHVVSEVCTEKERGVFANSDLAARKIFVLKEALYKAYHPVAGVYLDFLDVRVDGFGQNQTIRLHKIKGQQSPTDLWQDFEGELIESDTHLAAIVWF